jgi:hypothetical protein
MRERFEAVIAQATGRPLIGFMSGNQQHPDIMCEVFILAPPTSSTRARGRRGRRSPDGAGVAYGRRPDARPTSRFIIAASKSVVSVVKLAISTARPLRTKTASL